MSTKKETERSKLVQEKCQNLITVMLKDEDNKYCVDCDAKGPRWASWNLGVFLCIRCAGIHRNLGVHITRVKSVNLDTWTPEQVASLQHMGNSRARAVYEAQLPDGFRRPQTDAALESFIRAKYEQKKYVAKEWVPSPVPKVDWDKEIDEELEKQKRKKKSLAAAGGGSVILGSTLPSPSVEKKVATASKPTPIPAPLPKPKSSGHSPKTGRPQLELNNASAVLSSPTAAATNGGSHTLDLLGLSSPPPQAGNVSASANTHTTSTTTVKESSTSNGNASDDEFNNFFSANSQSRPQAGGDAAAAAATGGEKRSLAQEEADFFNQSVPSDAEKAKLTKDSIMALYASQPAVAAPVAVQPVAQAGGAGATSSNVNLLAGLNIGFPGQGTPQMNGGGFPAHHQQQQQPVGGGQFGGGLYNQKGPGQYVGGGQFGAAPQQMPAQFMNGGGGGFYHNATGFVGAAATAQQKGVQQQQPQQGMNFFPGNGMGGFQQTQPQNAMMMGGGGGLMGNGNQFPYAAGMQQQQQPPLMMMMPGLGAAGPAANGTAAATGMQKQFGNLNLGNVWQ